MRWSGQKNIYHSRRERICSTCFHSAKTEPNLSAINISEVFMVLHIFKYEQWIVPSISILFLTAAWRMAQGRAVYVCVLGVCSIQWNLEVASDVSPEQSSDGPLEVAGAAVPRSPCTTDALSPAARLLLWSCRTHKGKFTAESHHFWVRGTRDSTNRNKHEQKAEAAKGNKKRMLPPSNILEQ